jgi:hypothetical protein
MKNATISDQSPKAIPGVIRLSFNTPQRIA